MFCRNLMLAAVCVLAATVNSASARDAVNWAPNLQAAVNMAARQNQLVLIHFWAPNCPPCRALEQNVFSRPEVAQAISRDYVAVKVNAAAMPDTARKYGVDRWPMDVIVTPAGYAVHSMVSPQKPREYMQSLYQVASQRQPGRELTSNQPPANSGRNASWNQPSQGQQQFAARDQFQGGGTQSRWEAGSQDQFSDPRTQGQGERFAPPPSVSNPHVARGGQTSWDNQQVAQGSPDRFSGEQAPIGRPYADQYAPQQGWDDNRAIDPRSQGQFDPRTEQRPREDRFAGPPAPRQTQNPYVADRRGESRFDDAQPAAPRQPVERAPRGGGAPPMGLDGFCPVTLVEQTRWQRGDKRFGIIHRGYLYLFAKEADKQKFWKDPDMFAPILSGNDPVAYVETGRLILGHRRHGVFFRNQIYLFTSEESLQRFWNDPERYADVALQAMRRDRQGMR